MERGVEPSRMRPRLLILSTALALATTALFADWLPVPGAGWNHDEEARHLHWDTAKLADVTAKLRHLKPTGLVIVQDGKVVADWGDPARKVDVFSVRKSIVSALFGIAIAEGRINPRRTLAEIGIDDSVAPSLTPDEKRATIADLLTARSGIYHEAAYEFGAFAESRPARGSHPPGTFWFYNNFDFNVLGTIYTRLTGEGLFEAVEGRIARPIGMEDFSAADGRLVHEPVSEHPAYPMRMTARDLARFGVLYLNRGFWDGVQVVPAQWAAESTRRVTRLKDGRGYGYLWWQLPPSVPGSRGGFYAMGRGGQAIAVVPERGLVVSQTVEMAPGGTGLTTDQFLDLLGLIVAAAPAEAT